LTGYILLAQPDELTTLTILYERKQKSVAADLCTTDLHFLSPNEQSVIHWLIICGIQLLTPNI